jgi:hypothetical protein
VLVSRAVSAMMVACFCGTLFEADPPAGLCPHCDAAPALTATSAAEARELAEAYDEGLAAIRELPEAA